MQKLVPLLPQPALPLHGETPQGQQHATACHRVQFLPESCGVFCGQAALEAGVQQRMSDTGQTKARAESREQKDVKNNHEILRIWNVLDRAGTKREKRQTRGAACPDPCRKRCADFRQKEVRINTAGKRCVHGLQLQEMQPGRHADFVPGDPTATEACDSFVRERQGLNVFP